MKHQAEEGGTYSSSTCARNRPPYDVVAPVNLPRASARDEGTAEGGRTPSALQKVLWSKSDALFSVKRHWSSEPMLAAGGRYTEGVTGSAAPVSE
jgi:hypothetical protein